MSETTMTMEIDELIVMLKGLETGDLYKVMKFVVSETEKRSKMGVKVDKKKGSMAKGVVPPQLKKPRAWVEFTLRHALENGWESFVIRQKKKDKVTGEKVEEEIEMPGSVLHEGVYVYEGSVTEKCVTGKQLIHKDAMSLSKQRWTPKEKKGTHPELYEEFEAEFDASIGEEEDVSTVDDNASEVSGSTKKSVVRKTAAEKEAEKAAKKAEKDAEKAAKKAEKDAEKAAKKAEKDAEKAAKKAEKDAEKVSKKAEKDDKSSVKKAVKASGVPVAAVASSVAPVEKAVAPVKKMVATVKKEEWSCPADGMVHPWPYKGKQYLRNSDNEVWLRSEDGGCGDWMGIFVPAEDRIDDSIPEPVFEYEE